MGLPAISRLNSDLNALRFTIANLVVQEEYDLAIEELKNLQSQPSEYPSFHERIEKYVHHAIDLVNAIRAKRNVPGFSMLTQAKQQAITENYHRHFDELQGVLIKIEKIEKQLKSEDFRSTIIIVKALIHATLAVIILAFALETTRGFGQSVWSNLDDWMLKISDSIFDYLDQ